MSINAKDILAVTKSVTKEWTRQRKAEERGRSRASREYVYSDRVNFTDVAHQILPEAYQHASGGLPLAKRQFYYACRQKFLDMTGREITSNYFSQTLLVQYMNRHPETAAWKVVADPRGKLTIPNAGHEVRVPIGTLAIEEHLRKIGLPVGSINDFNPKVKIEWPSHAAGIRYRDLLYVEKEGFDPLFEQMRIAERFNMAIASGKGQSTVAMRHLADMTCTVGSGCRLLIFRDFDGPGFQIAKRLTTNGDWAYEQDLVKYEFLHEIDVVDIGLRLADVEKYDLFWAQEDACKHNLKCKCFKCQPLDQDEYDITDEEYKFLRSGKRVEINALTSPQLVEFLETKLTALDCHKPLIPDDATLTEAYRRALVIAGINKAIDDIRAKVIDSFGKAAVPKSLRRQLQKLMKGSQAAWDKALYDVALTKVRDADDD